MGLLAIWLLTALGLWIVSRIVPGIRADSGADLLIAALVLGFINAFIRPLLLALTLPLTVLTFGLFAIVLNALFLQLTAAIVPGFKVDGFGSALLGALLMAFLAILGFILMQWLMFGALLWI